MKEIDEVFNDKELVKKIKNRLPYLFQLAEAESARKIGHPAPFPIKLPSRLIELYSFTNDIILDPFMGSGSTAVAALRLKRNFVGYDTKEDYVKLAQQRISSYFSQLSLVDE